MEGTINPPVEAKPRPWRRWLVHSLQALWIIAAILIIDLLVFSVRPGYEQLTRICTEPECPDTQLTPMGLANITALGISLQSFATFQIFLVFAIALNYGTVSFLIFRARRNDPFALYVSLVLLLFGVFVTNYVDILSYAQPWLSILIDLLPGITLIAFTILCYVFPDGRFVPRWTRWAALGWVAAPVILMIAVATDTYELVEGPVSISLLLLLGTCLIAPIYRYRRLSSRMQRQQLKWILFGLIQLMVMMLVVVELLPFVFPALDESGTLPNLASNLFQALSLMIFPITVGISLLRYRLWDVDLVLNRTLVYVPLTSILTVIYTTSLALSQRISTAVTGEESQAVAIFTTIVLTTTFSPIKNSLQAFVDRHFKEAPGNLKELKELDRQVTEIIQALDHKSLAQRVVETIVKTHNAQGAALYLQEGKKMSLAYATPDWIWAEGEVSILLAEGETILGRLLLGPRRDRDDYTLEEIEEIRENTLPLVRNMQRLLTIQDDE